jgi:hypothetical protein
MTEHPDQKINTHIEEDSDSSSFSSIDTLLNIILVSFIFSVLVHIYHCIKSFRIIRSHLSFHDIFKLILGPKTLFEKGEQL